MDEPPAVKGQRPGDTEQPRDDPFGRPMPDGGLAEAMPDWLRRPPAWRETSARHAKEAPTPDTSPIDPRTLIDVEDLPVWLQRIAQRPGERPDRVKVAEPPRQPVPRVMPVVDPHRERRARPQSGESVSPSQRYSGDAPQPPSTFSGRPRRLRFLLALLLLGILAIVGIALLTSFF